jgi:hypothetical protein
VVFAKADKPDALSPPVLALVTVVLDKEEVPVALIVPVVIPVLAIIVPTETFVAVVLTRILAPDTFKLPVEILIEFVGTLLKLDNPDARIDAVVIVPVPVLATEILVQVKELPSKVLPLIEDATMLSTIRLLVEIFVVVVFVRVDNPDAFNVPLEIFVFLTLLEVILTVVNVPPIFTFPVKLKFDAVIVLADKVPAVIFVPITFVADNNPELTLVEIKLLDEMFVVVVLAKELIPDTLIAPFTSRFVVGDVVFTPKLPFVKNTVEFNCEKDIDAEVFKTIYIIY